VHQIASGGSAYILQLSIKGGKLGREVGERKERYRRERKIRRKMEGEASGSVTVFDRF